MTLNESFYTNAHSVTNIPLVSGSFEESKLDCAINGRYSSSWIIHAASTVVSRPIKSVYPVVNGPVDGYIGILNTTFRPKISKSSNEFVIMCTHSNTATSSSNNWAPNHFVPLVPKEDASKTGGEYCKKVFHFPWSSTWTFLSRSGQKEIFFSCKRFKIQEKGDMVWYVPGAASWSCRVYR